MIRTKATAGVVLAALSVFLAGCTGSFDVKQTEPIRVQIDGPPQTAEVNESDDEPQEFVIENAQQAESVEVEVEVTQVSTEQCTVLVTIKDPETNETLATKEVTVGGSNNTTASSSPAATGSTQGQTVTETIVVNIHGKDNIVVITDAQQGDAEVTIAAHEASASPPGNSTYAP